MNLVTLGITILGGLAMIWLLGGVLLRVGGLLLVVAGALGVALQRDPNSILVLAIGTLLWLAGHWHFALRHHGYKSPLARYVFCRWAPESLDPTASWSIPVAECDSATERRRST